MCEIYQNRVEEEVSSIILLKADWASLVIRSASSKIMILKLGQMKFLVYSLLIGILGAHNLCESLDFFPHDRDPAVIGGIQF